MVCVSRRIVSVAWLVLVTITLGARPISSLAKARVFSGSPPAQRVSIRMLRFSIQPRLSSFFRITST